MRVTAGRGSAELVAYDSGNWIYDELADEVAEELGADPDDILFLDNLANGGEKGAGLKVLKKALATARSRRQILVLWANSEGNEGQAKLVNWYLGTGLLERVPKRNGRLYANLLMAKDAPSMTDVFGK